MFLQWLCLTSTLSPIWISDGFACQRLSAYTLALALLFASFYDKNWKIFMKKVYFQNFSWFQYFVYKLCMIMCIDIAPSTTVLIKFRIYGKIALISPWNYFCSIPLGKCVFKGRVINRCKKFKFWNFWEHPLFEIWEYAFKVLYWYFDHYLSISCHSSHFPLIFF